MTKIAILPEASERGEIAYRAITGARQSLACTVGAALDALTAQLPEEDNSTLVIVQRQQPDRFFSRVQQQRLQELMNDWRKARDAGASLPQAEQTELNALVEAETLASGARAAALLKELSE